MGRPPAHSLPVWLRVIYERSLRYSQNRSAIAMDRIFSTASCTPPEHPETSSRVTCHRSCATSRSSALTPRLPHQSGQQEKSKSTSRKYVEGATFLFPLTAARPQCLRGSFRAHSDGAASVRGESSVGGERAPPDPPFAT